MTEHQRSSDSTVPPTNALVLGGGGPVGASWLSALLHVWHTAGIPLADADVVIGTSAGSVVGAWLTTQPNGLTEVPALMRTRAAWHASNASAGRRDDSMFESLANDPDQGTDATNVGRAATSPMPPISAAQADDLWKALLPAGRWSPRLRMTSVNADTGQARAWSSDDDLSLAVGVACSTAAPGIAPPVRVDEATWLDGGVRTGTNADLIVDMHVAHHGEPGIQETRPRQVLVVAPLASTDIEREQAFLVEHGYDVRVIVAEAFYATPRDLIDPHYIDVGATAGSKQAHDLAPDLLTWWNG